MKRPVFLGGATAALYLAQLAQSAQAASTELPDAAQVAYGRRERSAVLARDAFRTSVSNGDERRFAAYAYAASFSKGLPHAHDGGVDVDAFRAMRRAIDARDWSLLDARTSPGLRAVLTERVSDQSCLAGCDPRGIALGPPDRLDGPQTARDAIELAWLALTRDIPFAAYDNDPTIAAAVADLGVTPQMIFRPVGAAATGPMISQLALLDIPYPPFGALQQKYDFFAAQRDYLTTRSEWLAARNGMRVKIAVAPAGHPRYLRTGRDLAAWVVAANSPFLDAVSIVDALPAESQAGAWDTDGVLGALALAREAAGVGTFYQKFGVHLRLRPEEYFGLVDSGRPGVALADAVFASPAIDRLKVRNGTLLLPQAYPNGAPPHPSYPAAHATFAGAAATILKAHVNGQYHLPHPVVPAPDGLSLLAYNGPALTLGGEIDKLAANYAYGRHAAGVHFRQDSDAGLRFGEAAAVGVLRDIAAVSGSSFPGFRFATFDGRTIVIEASA